jgi:hypothetical protein
MFHTVVLWLKKTRTSDKKDSAFQAFQTYMSSSLWTMHYSDLRVLSERHSNFSNVVRLYLSQSQYLFE